MRKRDADTNSNVPQGDATLEGAQYRITYTNNGEEIENVVTTNRLGQAVLRNIPIGVLVTVKEISVPLGYKLDSRVHTYITTTDTKELEYDLIPEDFTEEVIKGRIQLYKQYETLDDLAEEQGAEFDVYLKSAGSYAAAKRLSATTSSPAWTAWRNKAPALRHIYRASNKGRQWSSACQ